MEAREKHNRTLKEQGYHTVLIRRNVWKIARLRALNEDISGKGLLEKALLEYLERNGDRELVEALKS